MVEVSHMSLLSYDVIFIVLHTGRRKILDFMKITKISSNLKNFRSTPPTFGKNEKG
jgi:hypothetical protein